MGIKPGTIEKDIIEKDPGFIFPGGDYDISPGTGNIGTGTV